MKKSQQQNQANNSIKEQAKSETQSGQTKPRFCAVFARHSVSARHFRANSYVPLLLALRPRAGGTEKSVQVDNLGIVKSVQYAGQKQHFHQFYPLRWTKYRFLFQSKDRRSSLVGRSSAPLVSSLPILTLSLIFISSMFGLVVFPPSASAANLTLTIPSSALVVQATPNQFSKSEAQRISVSTDSVGGYTLKLSSKHGNTLNNVSGSKIAPITSELTETAFSTSEDWNVWGFKPSKLEGEDNSDPANGKFIAAPEQGQDIILDTTNTSTNDIEGQANNYNITLGVKVDSTLPAGSYSNTFVLTATVNALKYDITYDAGNAESEVTNMPEPKQVTGETPNTTIPLTNTIPEWSGYVFQGWCTVKPVMKSGRDDCEGSGGTEYSSGAEFPLTMASTTTTLYAMWNELLLTDVIDAPEQPITFKVGDGIEMIMVADSQTRQFDPPQVTATTTTKWWPYYAIKDTPVTMSANAGEKYLITVVPEKGNKFTKWQKNDDGTEWTAIGTAGKYKTMQELTQAECKAAGTGGMNVTDTRNNVSYTVGIVSNGADFSRCWMFSNLRLEGSTEKNKVTLTPTDSDVSENFEMPVPPATASDWVDYWSKKEMIECKGKAGKYAEVSGTNVNHIGTCNENISAVTEFYYNWYSAIANDAVGSTPTNGGSNEEGSAQNASFDQQAKGSICPKNWRLMEEGTTGDGILITDHDEIDAFVETQKIGQENWSGRLPTSGYVGTGQQRHVGIKGSWWSASRHSDADGRGLLLDSGGAYLNTSNKNAGSPVRCILRNEEN